MGSVGKKWCRGYVREVGRAYFGAGSKRDRLAIDNQFGAGGRHNRCPLVVGSEGESINGGIDRRQEDAINSWEVRAQRHQRRFLGRFAKNDGVRAQSTPAPLTGGKFIAVVNRHPESELRSGLQRRREAERSGRQPYFVNGFFRGAVAGDDSFSWTATRRVSAWTWTSVVGEILVLDNNGSQSPFDAAQCVVVKRHNIGPWRVCDHKLDRIAVPGAIGGVLMVVVRDDETEVHVINVPDDLNRRGLIVRPGPVRG